jgi:hypothetical protein
MLRRTLIALPAIVLLAVAAVQMTLATTAGLSPWKGGGFGMFASVDGLPFRWLRIYLTAPERSEELAVPQSLGDDARRVLTWPREQALDRLARAVVARERRQGRPIDQVRIQVWRADVSPTLEVVESLMCERTVAGSLAAHSCAR